MAKRGTSAYWLGGEEHCPHCLLRYAFAVERRCVSCDGPACPHCVTVVHETREVVCRDCELADEPADERADKDHSKDER
jgi:hypothetical protein